MTAAGNLANTYTAQERYEEAELLQAEVVEKGKELFGNDHPITIRAKANLAILYENQKRSREAATLKLEVLEQRRRLEGNDHPNTVMAAASLAASYKSGGQYEKAEDLLILVLEQWQRTLGKYHPITLSAAQFLNEIHAAMAQAKNWFGGPKSRRPPPYYWRIQMSVKRWLVWFSRGKPRLGFVTRKRYGSQDASFYARKKPKRKQRDVSETPSSIFSDVEDMEMNWLQLTRRIKGKQHPKTIEATMRLAARYMHQRRFREASDLLLELVNYRIKENGEHSSATISAISTLAVNYMEQEDWETGASLLYWAKSLSSKVFGERHKNTESCTRGLALALTTLEMNGELPCFDDLTT